MKRFSAPLKLIFVGKNVTVQCIRFFKKIIKWPLVMCGDRYEPCPPVDSGLRLRPGGSSPLQSPHSHHSSAALELIDYSQEEADDFITQGEARGDYKDSGWVILPGCLTLACLRHRVNVVRGKLGHTTTGLPLSLSRPRPQLMPGAAIRSPLRVENISLKRVGQARCFPSS